MSLPMPVPNACPSTCSVTRVVRKGNLIDALRYPKKNLRILTTDVMAVVKRAKQEVDGES